MSKSQASPVPSSPSSSRHRSSSSSRRRSPSESSRCERPRKRPRLTSGSPPLLLSADQYQQLGWQNLEKSIHAGLNKVNISNLPSVIRELFHHNMIRARGIMARRIINAQTGSPFNTHVYAALVSVINTKFPQIGELIIKRLILSFRQTYQRNDKSNCLATTGFIAHLVNQNVLHEIVALQILVLLLENPSDDSIELAIGLTKERIFLLHEPSLHKRTLNMIEDLFTIPMDQFQANPGIPSGLDLVDEDDQHTHPILLNDPCDPEAMLDVFQYDPLYEENEEKYNLIRRRIFDETNVNEDKVNSSSSDTDEDETQFARVENQKKQSIINLKSNLATVRENIYKTIQSSLTGEECVRKLFKMNLPGDHEMELCQVILNSCAQKRTYEGFFGTIGQRLCSIKKEYVQCFEKAFQDQYDLAHHLDNVKLRIVPTFFAQLLLTDSISWSVLSCIRLTEENTTSSSRVFIKYLFLALYEFLGLTKLNDRLTDLTMVEYIQGLFPRDDPKNTKFSINFFESIGLDGLTNDLRQFLETNPTPTPPS